MPLDCIKQTIRKNRQLSVPILIQISHIFKTIIKTEAVGLSKSSYVRECTPVRFMIPSMTDIIKSPLAFILS